MRFDDLFFSDNSKSKNNITEKFIPTDKKMNLPSKSEISKDNNNITNEKMKEKKSFKGKIPFQIMHKKSNSLNYNINKKIKKKKLKISTNIIEEKFNKIKNGKKISRNIEKGKDNESLRVSVQSMNDSKIMELANKYIKSEESLDKNEIREILNTKKDKKMVDKAIEALKKVIAIMTPEEIRGNLVPLIIGLSKK